jgi:phosphoglycolate phosphatase
MIKKKYSAILFDVDGTLIDTSEGIIKSVEYTVDNLNLRPLSEEEKKSFIGPKIFDSLKNVYPELSESEVKDAAKIFRDRYSTVDLLKAKPYDGVTELLKKLKKNNYLVGIATYKREDYALEIVKYFGIADYCDCIEGSDFDGKLTKQDIINKCIDKLNTDKSKILMVGDTDNDKIGAENAGVDFLAVTFGFGYKPDNKSDCFTADSCREIEKIIFEG